MLLSLEQIARALGGRVVGREVRAPSPGHSSVDDGMAIKLDLDAEDGFIVHLFNGGDPLAAKDFVRDRLELPSWQPKKAKSNNHNQLRIVATYRYVNADDVLFYEVVRYDPKKFLQRRPLPGGGYAWGRGDSPEVLYRLPDLIKFPDATVFFCEGEKDADRVAELGLVATTVSGSAADKLTPELVAPLRGRDVFILQDNDAKGVRRATAAAEALHGIAASLRVILLPDLPSKGDVSDYLDAGHTGEELEAICLSAPIWQPGNAMPEITPDTTDDTGLEVFDAGDDINLPPPREWLLGNQFCRKFLSSLIAPCAGGKTALRTVQFLSLATGRALTEQYVFRRCRVLLVSLEDDIDELRRRIAAACIHFDIDRSELKGWLFYAAPKGIKLAEMHKGARQLGKLECKLRAAVTSFEPDIVSLDPFVKTHALEENDNGAMDFVCDLLARLAVECNIAVDTPHHARKGAATPGDPDVGRGASGTKDAGRLVYTLTRMSEEEAKQFSISPQDRAQFVRLDNAKVNTAPPSQTATWFKIIGVQLGNGTAEYPSGDEVQTVVPWNPPDTWAGLSSVALNAALTDIDAGLLNGQRYSDAPKASTRAAWRVVQKHCPDRSEMQCREIIKTWVRNGVLFNEPYDDPIERKARQGLRLDPEKQPS
ncbi:5S rRNA maturation endonuclease (ribonuclease M5) [Bradyrhizobium sp. USDA 4474]